MTRNATLEAGTTTVFISMSAVLGAFQRGQVDFATLEDSSNLFVFGCSREHVLTPGQAPYEIYRGAEGVDWDGEQYFFATSALPQEVLAKWLAFREVIEKADSDGRVWWGFGSIDPFTGDYTRCAALPLPRSFALEFGFCYPGLADWLNTQDGFSVRYRDL